MEILLLGDVHEDEGSINEIIASAKCDFILQVGDLGIYCDFAKPVYFIAGNHEDWSTIESMDNNEIKFKNLHHINTAEIIQLKNNSEVINISGINGNYSPKRYRMKISDRKRHFTENDVAKCKKLQNIDIFLSHEAPAGTGFVKRSKDVGVESVKEILDSIKPRFLVFGHHHVFFEKAHVKTKILGLGYARKEYCILDTSRNKIERIIKGDEW